MAKKNLSLKEANAYKARAEGTAALVTAWMPLIKVIMIFGIVFLCSWLGVNLKQFLTFLSAIK